MNPTEQWSVVPEAIAMRGGPHMNALKHGLRSKTVLLPGDDVAEFRRVRQELYDLYRPRTGNEARCVEAMASHEWSMERCRQWRAEYHAKLHALLYGNADGTPAIHCEGDPHRWHHSAMDCALEEGRLGRLLDRERRRLQETQKLRRQNLILDAAGRADGSPVVSPVEEAHEAAATLSTSGPVSRAPLPNGAAVAEPFGGVGPAAHPSPSGRPSILARSAGTVSDGDGFAAVATPSSASTNKKISERARHRASLPHAGDAPRTEALASRQGRAENGITALGKA